MNNSSVKIEHKIDLKYDEKILNCIKKSIGSLIKHSFNIISYLIIKHLSIS